MSDNDQNGHGLTLRELVLEIRTDVKALDAKIEEIDRNGSIGTREELADHEHRIRATERWVYTIPPAVIIALASAAAPIAHYL